MTDILGLRWKITLGVGAILLIVAAGFLARAQIENRHLVTENAKLDARINDKTTGYVAQLAQERTNVETLKGALETQNQKLRDQAAESGQRLEELTATVTKVQRENLKLRSDASKLMGTKPQGDTLEQRLLDIDRRNLETLE